MELNEQEINNFKINDDKTYNRSYLLMTLLQWDLDGCFERLAELQPLLTHYKPVIVLLSETHLCPHYRPPPLLKQQYHPSEQSWYPNPFELYLRHPFCYRSHNLLS